MSEAACMGDCSGLPARLVGRRLAFYCAYTPVQYQEQVSQSGPFQPLFYPHVRLPNQIRLLFTENPANMRSGVLMTFTQEAEDLAWQTLQKCGRRYDPLAYARFMARRRFP